MSRVDQALRRSAGRAAGEPAVAPDSTRVEDFPAEDRRVAAVVAKPRSFVPAAPAVMAPVERLTHLAPTVDGKVVVDSQISGASVEEYRRLATTLHLMQEVNGLRALIVSSALPRDGKTLTSTNLALTLSESYKRRVLLIDADFRRPSIHEIFGLSNATGLADGLRGDGPISMPFAQVSQHLTVLTAGIFQGSPMAGLTSERMRSVMTDARARFDWVIVDTPPVGLISDANLLASLVDGVLLVIGAGATPYAAIQRAVSEFGRERIVGVVLNRVTEDIARKTYYGEYYDAGREASRT
jgi:capsular exopolysaccharide synthesis family protein